MMCDSTKQIKIIVLFTTVAVIKKVMHFKSFKGIASAFILCIFKFSRLLLEHQWVATEKSPLILFQFVLSHRSQLLTFNPIETILSPCYPWAEKRKKICFDPHKKYAKTDMIFFLHVIDSSHQGSRKCVSGHTVGIRQIIFCRTNWDSRLCNFFYFVQSVGQFD